MRYVVLWVSLFACDTLEKAAGGGGTSESSPSDETATTTEPDQPVTATDTTGGEITPAEMCDHLQAAFLACVTSSTTSTATGTGTATGEETCEEVYAECSQGDLQILIDLGDCLVADCENLSCYDTLSELSNACLGLADTDTGGSGR